jgi:O-antigen/teichoic acid export membrane protein
MFSATAIIQVSYIIYSRNSFKETRYLFFWDRSLFYKIISFAGWSLFGSFATVLKNQGVNIILNMFFGPTVNASKAVAAQVEGATSSFVSNIQTAIKPQIIKSYAINNISYLNTLVFTGAKFSYYLILCISLPIILETEYVLQIWLKTVPEYSVMFVRLSLIIVLIDTLSVTLMSSIQATGRIRLYQVVISSLLISILPISFVFLKMGYPPTIAYFVSLVVFVIILVARISIVSKYVKFSISDYLKNVVLISLLVTVISFMIPYIIVYSFDSSIKRLVFTILFSILSVVLTVYFVGMDKIEKEKIIFIIRNFNAK